MKTVDQKVVHVFCRFAGGNVRREGRFLEGDCGEPDEFVEFVALVCTVFLNLSTDLGGVLGICTRRLGGLIFNMERIGTFAILSGVDATGPRQAVVRCSFCLNILENNLAALRGLYVVEVMNGCLIKSDAVGLDLGSDCRHKDRKWVKFSESCRERIDSWNPVVAATNIALIAGRRTLCCICAQSNKQTPKLHISTFSP